MCLNYAGHDSANNTVELIPADSDQQLTPDLELVVDRVTHNGEGRPEKKMVIRFQVLNSIYGLIYYRLMRRGNGLALLQKRVTNKTVTHFTCELLKLDVNLPCN